MDQEERRRMEARMGRLQERADALQEVRPTPATQVRYALDALSRAMTAYASLRRATSEWELAGHWETCLDELALAERHLDAAERERATQPGLW
jgi:hypothetical protein